MTRPGRALITEHRAGLTTAENIGNAHHARWLEGQPTPAAPTFDRLADEWLAVPDDGTLTVCWPARGRSAMKAAPQRGPE